jgi:H+/Cl- antiporter ClcA
LRLVTGAAQERAPTEAPREPTPPGPPDAEIDGRAYLKLVLLGAAIGIPAALVAALFLALVHELEGWLWTDLPDALGDSGPPWWLILALPVAGAALVAAARRLLPGDGGHAPLGGLDMSPTPVSHAPGIALAAIGTLGFGAVLGPEMPVIALGGAVGMAVAGFAKLGPRPSAVAATAGSFSGVSALFGGPLVAGVLLVEAGAGAGMKQLTAVLLPGFVAAAVGYMIFIGFGDWGGLDAPGLQVPNLETYDGGQLDGLLVGIAVGLLAACVVGLVRAVGRRVAASERSLGVTKLLLAGGLAIGLLTLIAEALGADSSEVLFSGQSSLGTIVEESSTGVIAVVIVAKFLAYGVSLGCGFRGGPIFPACFLGVALAALAVVWFDVSPTLAIALGTAAGMAAQTRLLVSPILFASLLVGSAGHDAISATVIAGATAWLAASALDRRAEARAAAGEPAAAGGPAAAS